MNRLATESAGMHWLGAEGARRRGAVNGAAVVRSVLSIEGEALTLRQVADRLGVSTTCAEVRLRRERAKPGPVTWAGLQLRGAKA